MLQVQLKHISFNRNSFTAERILPQLVCLRVFKCGSAECWVTELYQTNAHCSATLKVLGFRNLNGSKEEYHKAQQLWVPTGSWKAKEAHQVMFSWNNLKSELQVSKWLTNWLYVTKTERNIPTTRRRKKKV